MQAELELLASAFIARKYQFKHDEQAVVEKAFKNKQQQEALARRVHESTRILHSRLSCKSRISIIFRASSIARIKPSRPTSALLLIWHSPSRSLWRSGTRTGNCSAMRVLIPKRSGLSSRKHCLGVYVVSTACVSVEEVCASQEAKSYR